MAVPELLVRGRRVKDNIATTSEMGQPVLPQFGDELRPFLFRGLWSSQLRLGYLGLDPGYQSAKKIKDSRLTQIHVHICKRAYLHTCILHFNTLTGYKVRYLLMATLRAT